MTELETCMILNGWDNIEAGAFFQEDSQLGCTALRRSPSRELSSILIRWSFFSLWVIDQWNGLPQAMGGTKTIPQFKARPDKNNIGTARDIGAKKAS